MLGLDKEAYSKSILRSINTCDIPAEMLFCPDIKATGIRVYCTIKYNPNFKEGLGVYFPEVYGMCVSTKTLSEMTGLSVGVVRMALKALLRSNFIGLYIMDNEETQGHRISFYGVMEYLINQDLMAKSTNICDIRTLKLMREERTKEKTA